MNNRIVLPLVAIACCLAIGCSKSTRPQDSDGYSVVVYSHPWALVLDSESLKVCDSIPLQPNIISMIADHRQSQLIVHSGNTHDLIVYDLVSGEQLASRTVSGTVSLLEIGKRVLVSQLDSLRILDLATLATTESDTARLWGGKVIPGGVLVAGDYPSPPPPHLTGISAFFDLETNWYDTLQLPQGVFAFETTPHPDGRRAIVWATSGPGVHRLYVEDSESRVATSVTNLVPFMAWFRVAFSPTGDTSYVAASQQLGDPDVVGCPVGGLFVISTSTSGVPSLLARLDFDSPVYDVAVSPDGRRLYCAVGHARCFGEDHGGFVAVYDAQSLQQIGVIEGQLFPYHVEIGPELPD